ncbi:type III PLP-dependent enzyme [Gandjariella thermophila]|uniref:ornithine decarboxylase n=1 Tax=Gandjariella thermophila TaxID=1931992 RepID=A0A4D4J5E7_9PSEU|nr:type III PLP-dependent enzyme [Gandjariella thermophila]GDY31915.1 ornithine decarboxylase [Gandjariella thermophila]
MTESLVTTHPPETGSPRPDTARTPGISAPVLEFLRERRPETPCLVIDLDVVAQRFHQVRAALPWAEVYYAVKANPAREVVRLLAELGANFDVASPAEIDLCLAQGARPECVSYSNPIKKLSHIEYAYRRGVRLFAFDSEQDLEHIAAAAPGSSVFCRILVASPTTEGGARTPFGTKFGCAPEMAVDLLHRAARLGLDACGASFHVGSQQLDPTAWDAGIATVARVAEELDQRSVPLRVLNLGGGFPATYLETPPPLAGYGAAIEESVRRHFGDRPLRLLVEPGRAIVADAGVIRSEVVLVARKSADDERRWVYLDIGRYGGLAETENEAIAYRLVTSRDSGPTGPVVIAGPTCDGDDVLYQRRVYRLPLDLRAGDHVDLLGAGAYTASYASVAFNGFAPLTTYCVPADALSPTEAASGTADAHGNGVGDKERRRCTTDVISKTVVGQ